MSKYFKNFILCGNIDHYCLLCEELFQRIPDVEKHIRWEKHRKNIKSQAYFPKYRKDFIYKIANQFYCEICNTVCPDIAAAGNHINKESHKAARVNPETEMKNFIGDYNSGCVIINKVIINMTQWNSIVNKKCLVCNIGVRNVEEHIILKEHIINLIQSETIYENERYYRKINEDQYHCFTCKKVFSAQDFHDHWPNCKNIDEIEIDKLKEAKSLKTVEMNAKMSDIEKQLIKTLQEFYYIEDQNNFGTCKHCSTVVAIDFKSMIEHMKNEHDQAQTVEPEEKSDRKHNTGTSSKDKSLYVPIYDYGKRRSELATYGKAHSIKLNHNGSKGWCLLCDRYISAHKNNFEQHVNGPVHKGNLDIQSPKNKKMHNFKTKSVLRCTFAYSLETKEFWVNHEYSIDIYSFFLLHQIEDDPHFKKTKCYTCIELFPQGEERKHCETTKHKNNLLEVKFIMSIAPAEFIREIRPNLYHCGFCNKTFPFLPQLEKHLVSLTHLMLKRSQTSIIRNIVPIITLSNSDDMYTRLLRYGIGNL